MKNILARGGIEFLAVMLGISGSLWVDETRISSNAEKEFRIDLVAIHNELVDDLNTIKTAMAFNYDMIDKVDHLLSILETSKIDVNALDTIPLFNIVMSNRSFFGKKSAYLSSKSAGHLNRNSHNPLVLELTSLYGQTYARMETNNTLMDEIMFADDKSKIYLSHQLRGFIYDDSDFYRSVNSTYFYNWAVYVKNILSHLLEVMEITQGHMVKVEAQLRLEVQSQ
jgi:hypothetical protein